MQQKFLQVYPEPLTPNKTFVFTLCSLIISLFFFFLAAKAQLNTCTCACVCLSVRLKTEFCQLMTAYDNL